MQLLVHYAAVVLGSLLEKNKTLYPLRLSSVMCLFVLKILKSVDHQSERLILEFDSGVNNISGLLSWTLQHNRKKLLFGELNA